MSEKEFIPENGMDLRRIAGKIGETLARRVLYIQAIIGRRERKT